MFAALKHCETRVMPFQMWTVFLEHICFTVPHIHCFIFSLLFVSFCYCHKSNFSIIHGEMFCLHPSQVFVLVSPLRSGFDMLLILWDHNETAFVFCSLKFLCCFSISLWVSLHRSSNGAHFCSTVFFVGYSWLISTNCFRALVHVIPRKILSASNENFTFSSDVEPSVWEAVG